MYAIDAIKLPVYPADVLQSLSQRNVKSVSEALDLVQRFEDAFASFPFEPTYTNNRLPGVYYLRNVSAAGVREYSGHESISPMSVNLIGSNLAHVELQQYDLDAGLIHSVAASLHHNRATVLSWNDDATKHATQAEPKIQLTPELFESLDAMQRSSALPMLTVCTRTMGSFCAVITAVADLVLATSDATFAFPMLSDDSVFELSKLGRPSFGSRFGTDHAFDIGLVDFVGSEESVWAEVQSLRVVLEGSMLVNTGVLSTGIAEAEISSGRAFAVRVEDDDTAARITSAVSWPIEGTIQFNMADNEMTAEALIAIETTVSRIQHRVHTVIVCGEWTQPAFSTKPSQRHTMASCIQHAQTSMAPVLCVVSGCASSSQLPLMLEADWRVCTAQTVVSIGPTSTCMPLHSMHAAGIVHGIEADFEAALHNAQVLAEQLQHAPPTGLMHTSQLMRTTNTLLKAVLQDQVEFSSAVAADVDRYDLVSLCSGVLPTKARLCFCQDATKTEAQALHLLAVSLMGICRRDDSSISEITKCGSGTALHWSSPTQSMSDGLITTGGSTLPSLQAEIGVVDCHLVATEWIHTEQTVATVELNDPRHYNAEDIPLMHALKIHLAQLLAAQASGTALDAVVLQAAGAHFCTGGAQHEDAVLRQLMPQAVAGAAAFVSYLVDCVMTLKKLSVPIVAAVHGKVIGGGLALALTADWRVCTAPTIFNHANLPRNMNPITYFSQSMSEAVGRNSEKQLYFNDSVLSAKQLLGMGLVDFIAPSQSSAKSCSLNVALRVTSQQSALPQRLFSTSEDALSILCTESVMNAVVTLESAAFAAAEDLQSEFSKAESYQIIGSSSLVFDIVSLPRISVVPSGCVEVQMLCYGLNFREVDLLICIQ